MGSSHFSVRMKTLLLLLPTLSALAGTPGEDRQEAPELPQFLQQLPFFSQIQSLQEAFQHLQATIPPEIMTQLQQSLPPLLGNLLNNQPAGRSLNLIPANIQQLIQQLQAGNFQQLVQQFQSGSLQQQLQQLGSSLPPEALQQIQQSLPPFLASFLLQPTGRAEVIKAEELTEKQENDISEFIRRCNGLFGYNNGVAGTYNSYPNTGNSGYYGYNTGYNYNTYPYTTYSGAYTTNGQSPYPYITVQNPTQYFPAGRSGDIDTKKGGKGKHGWWHSNYNQKPSNNYNQIPYNNFYQKPFNNFNQNPYANYNPYFNNAYIQNPYQYQYPNYNYGTIGTEGVVVPATGTTSPGTITAIREGEEQ